MATVLITGSNGYIGSALTDILLANHYNVVGVDNLMYTPELRTIYPKYHCNHSESKKINSYGNYYFYHADTSDTDHMMYLMRMHDVDSVVWLSAIVGAPACKLYDKNYVYEVNCASVRRFIRAIEKQQHKLNAFIFPNTNSGYGTTAPGVICTEESEINPISLYAQTKCDAECEVKYHPKSIIFRLATIFGVGETRRPRMDLLFNDWVYQLLTYRSLTLFSPEFRRNFVHIQDVAQIMHKAILYPERFLAQKSNIFNLGNDDCNVTKRELALFLQKEIGEITGKYMTLKIEGDIPDEDGRDYLVSNHKIQKVLNSITGPGSYSPWQMIDFRQGLKEMVQVIQSFRGGIPFHLTNAPRKTA